VNNVDELLAALHREPDDLTAVAALTDALIEERDMQPTEAARHAEHAMQVARDARDLAAAATLLRPAAPWHAALVRDIKRACWVTDSAVAVIIIVNGDGKPQASACEPTEPGAEWWGITITVGARWVLHHFRTDRNLLLLAAPAGRQTKRPR